MSGSRRKFSTEYKVAFVICAITEETYWTPSCEVRA